MLPVKVKLLNLGGVEKEYREVIEFYLSRIERMCRLTVMKGSRIPDEAILLDPEGEELTSDEFFNMLKHYSSQGMDITFVIGPPEGFGEEEKKGKRLISLSRLTMRHELAYLVLLEQIYRALLRMKGTKYER